MGVPGYPEFIAAPASPSGVRRRRAGRGEQPGLAHRREHDRSPPLVRPRSRDALARADMPPWLSSSALGRRAVPDLPAADRGRCRCSLARFWDEQPQQARSWRSVAALPVVVYLVAARPTAAQLLVETAREYVAFMALLGALFVDHRRHLPARRARRHAGRSTPRSSPSARCWRASIGTTGASALLIRPLLRANAQRQRTRHIVVFFIFIVANGGGLLTPLGDPPLFLGFLRGVPFTWTLRLAPPWALVNGALLAVLRVDRPSRSCASARAAARRHAGAALATAPLRIEGGLEPASGCSAWSPSCSRSARTAGAGRAAARALRCRSPACSRFAALSLATTPREVHEANRFSWAPILEVAAVFVGIFVTMVPALGVPRGSAARASASPSRGSSSGPRARCRACSTTRRPT